MKNAQSMVHVQVCVYCIVGCPRKPTLLKYYSTPWYSISNIFTLHRILEKSFKENCRLKFGQRGAVNWEKRKYFKEPKPENEKNLSKADSAEDCYMRVRNNESTANAMTWVGGGSKDCWAIFNANKIWKYECEEKANCSTCMFGGK